MLNAYSIGFACIATVVVAGVDYFDQSNKAGVSFGELTAGAYVDTISGRFLSAKEEKLAENAERERQSRWRQGGKPYLPEAPEGWTRRALLEGDDSAIMPPDAGKENTGAGASLLDQMQAREDVKRHKARAKNSWIYERGTETVFVEVKTVERANSNSLIGLVGATLEGQSFGIFDNVHGYDVVGGVGFTEKLNHKGEREHHYRVLKGTLGFGHELHFTVHANASRKSTLEILGAIDFDGLNSLLPLPMETVGNDVVLPDDVDPVDQSKAMYSLREEFLRLRSVEAQHRIANMNTSALLVNTYAQAYGGADGIMDITGGQSVDMSVLIDLGFRTAMMSLMEGKSAEEITAEVDKMVKQVMVVADAETAAAAARAANAPAPEMSPELAAELSNPDQASLQPNANTQIASIIAEATAKPLMQIDKVSSEESDGQLVSRAIGPGDPRMTLAQDTGMSDQDFALSMQDAVIQFALHYQVPISACRFAVERTRVECAADATQREQAYVTAGLTGAPAQHAEASPLAERDDAAPAEAEEAPNMIYSKRLPADKIRKIQENPQDPAMRIGMGLAVKRFEGKMGLARGSCTFSMTNYRVECENAKPAAESGILGIVNKATGGALSGQTEEQPKRFETGEKPKRLELSGGQGNSGGRCVGSFCD